MSLTFLWVSSLFGLSFQLVGLCGGARRGSSGNSQPFSSASEPVNTWAHPGRSIQSRRDEGDGRYCGLASNAGRRSYGQRRAGFHSGGSAELASVSVYNRVVERRVALGGDNPLDKINRVMRNPVNLTRRRTRGRMEGCVSVPEYMYVWHTLPPSLWPGITTGSNRWLHRGKGCAITKGSRKRGGGLPTT